MLYFVTLEEFAGFLCMVLRDFVWVKPLLTTHVPETFSGCFGDFLRMLRRLSPDASETFSGCSGDFLRMLRRLSPDASETFSECSGDGTTGFRVDNYCPSPIPERSSPIRSLSPTGLNHRLLKVEQVYWNALTTKKMVKNLKCQFAPVSITKKNQYFCPIVRERRHPRSP